MPKSWKNIVGSTPTHNTRHTYREGWNVKVKVLSYASSAKSGDNRSVITEANQWGMELLPIH